jgi:hypothetical protein
MGGERNECRVVEAVRVEDKVVDGAAFDFSTVSPAHPSGAGRVIQTLSITVLGLVCSTGTHT